MVAGRLPFSGGLIVAAERSVLDLVPSPTPYIN